MPTSIAVLPMRAAGSVRKPGRMPPGPAGGTLVELGDAVHGRLVERLADELQRQRQPVAAEPRRDDESGLSGDVERHPRLPPVVPGSAASSSMRQAGSRLDAVTATSIPANAAAVRSRSSS